MQKIQVTAYNSIARINGLHAIASMKNYDTSILFQSFVMINIIKLSLLTISLPSLPSPRTPIVSVKTNIQLCEHV
jgi:hypothetical protein